MESKNIYITRQIPEIGIKMLRDKGYNVTVSSSENGMTKPELIQALSEKKYDAIISLLNDHIDASVFDACPTLKLVANYCVGFNNIDIEEAKKRGIKVTNTRGTSSSAVAEHTVALILSLTTRLVEGDLFIREGKYKGWDPSLLMGQDLTGKTLGLIGAGAIGRIVGKILSKGFDCKINYYDPFRNDNFEKEYDAHFMELESVLKESDIISIHVPLLPETHHLITKERINMMKKTAILINTARGSIVDEKALVEALQNGVIYGAGLDVYENEPELTEGLAKLSNVVLTPHIASARPSARVEMSKLACDNVISFFEKNGEVITSVY